MPKRTITDGLYKLRMQIFERDNFTCQLCGRSTPDVKLELDHIKPVAEGGTDNPENLRTTCYACNRGRGALMSSKPPRLGGKLDHAARKSALANHIYGLLMKWGGLRVRDIAYMVQMPEKEVQLPARNSGREDWHTELRMDSAIISGSPSTYMADLRRKGSITDDGTLRISDLGILVHSKWASMTIVKVTEEGLKKNEWAKTSII